MLIRLTCESLTFYLNPDHLIMVAPAAQGSIGKSLLTVGDRQTYCDQTPEEVVRLITPRTILEAVSEQESISIALAAAANQRLTTANYEHANSVASLALEVNEKVALLEQSAKERDALALALKTAGVANPLVDSEEVVEGKGKIG